MTRECDDRCWDAESPVMDCMCVCNGENHGRSRTPEMSRTREEEDTVEE